MNVNNNQTPNFNRSRASSSSRSFRTISSFSSILPPPSEGNVSSENSSSVVTTNAELAPPPIPTAIEVPMPQQNRCLPHMGCTIS